MTWFKTLGLSCAPQMPGMPNNTWSVFKQWFLYYDPSLFLPVCDPCIPCVIIFLLLLRFTSEKVYQGTPTISTPSSSSPQRVLFSQLFKIEYIYKEWDRIMGTHNEENVKASTKGCIVPSSREERRVWKREGESKKDHFDPCWGGEPRGREEQTRRRVQQPINNTKKIFSSWDTSQNFPFI